MSLRDVHAITTPEINRILAGQPYESIVDFYHRAKPSRALLRRLATVGALDSLVTAPHLERAAIIAYVRALTAHSPKESDTPPEDQGALFAETGEYLPEVPERISHAQELANELDIVHTELSGHLIDPYQPMLEQIGVTPADQLLAQRNNSEVFVAGARVATQTPPMKSGKRVVFISLDDGTGCADCTFFTEAQRRSGPLLFGTRLLLVRGRIRRTGEKGVSIQAEQAWDLKETFATWTALRKSGINSGDAETWLGAA